MKPLLVFLGVLFGCGKASRLRLVFRDATPEVRAQQRERKADDQYTHRGRTSAELLGIQRLQAGHDAGDEVESADPAGALEPFLRSQAHAALEPYDLHQRPRVD